MLHFLLILLALVGLWKLLSHGRASGATLVTGLRRLALVLAIAGAGLGGLVGYYAQSQSSGGAVAGVVIGFSVIWMAALVLIWIVKGFLA
jgi:hypothetical protein